VEEESENNLLAGREGDVRDEIRHLQRKFPIERYEKSFFFLLSVVKNYIFMSSYFSILFHFIIILFSREIDLENF
jgi:hypothetical protein